MFLTLLGSKHDILSVNASAAMVDVDEEQKLFADLWIKQSDIMLRGVSLIPLVELGILAGWYGLKKDGQEALATAAAVGGAIVMVLATIYMSRTVQYVTYFRGRMGPLIAGVPRGIVTGKTACMLVPITCLAINLSLAAPSWIATAVQGWISN